MQLFSILLLLTRMSSMISAAPSPRSSSAKDFYPALAVTNSGSLPNLTMEIYTPLFPELNTTDDTKTFHVPNTYITLLWVLHSDQRIVLKLLRNMINDAINQVTNNIESFGDIVLPDDRDPYVEDRFAGKAPQGGYISMQSPQDGPAHGRKLTWGNVRDALLGLRQIMIKGGRPCKITFHIRHDIVGIIGWGSVTPGEPSFPPSGLGVGLDGED